MKNARLLLSVVQIFVVTAIFGQRKPDVMPDNYIPWLDSESQSNVTVIFNALGPTRTPRETPNIPCPPKYVNLLSNSNFLTTEERKWVLNICSKLEHVTTNSAPVGSILLTELTKTNADWLVSRFRDTNFDALEEVFFAPPRYDNIEVRSRTKSGDGYDIVMGKTPDATENRIFELWQIKNNVRDGLYLGGIKDDHYSSYKRYVKGKTLGKWFIWAGDGKIVLEAEFKVPYDFDKYVVRMPGY